VAELEDARTTVGILLGLLHPIAGPNPAPRTINSSRYLLTVVCNTVYCRAVPAGPTINGGLT